MTRSCGTAAGDKKPARVGPAGLDVPGDRLSLRLNPRRRGFPFLTDWRRLTETDEWVCIGHHLFADRERAYRMCEPREGIGDAKVVAVG